jgi:hypothetical protein
MLKPYVITLISQKYSSDKISLDRKGPLKSSLSWHHFSMDTIPRPEKDGLDMLRGDQKYPFPPKTWPAEGVLKADTGAEPDAKGGATVSGKGRP